MFTMIMAILAAPCMAAAGVLFILLQKKNREIEAHEHRHKQMIEKLTLLDVDLNKSEDEIDSLKDKLGRLKYELKAYQEKDPEWIARNPRGPKGMQGLDFVARCNRDENGERKKNIPDRRAKRMPPVLNSPVQSRPQVNELPIQSDNLLEGIVLGGVIVGIAGSDLEKGQPVFQGAGGEFLGGGASGGWEIAPPTHDIVIDDSVKPYTTGRESIIACEPEPVKETYSSPAYESHSYSDSGSSSSSSSSSDSCSSSDSGSGGGGCD